MYSDWWHGAWIVCRQSCSFKVSLYQCFTLMCHRVYGTSQTEAAFIVSVYYLSSNAFVALHYYYLMRMHWCEFPRRRLYLRSDSDIRIIIIDYLTFIRVDFEKKNTMQLDA